jgi:hypothetical protein
MATKWIKVPVTLHMPGEKFVPFTFDSNGGVTAGCYDINEIPPLTPVELDEAEADALLKRFEADDRTNVATDEEIAAAKQALADKAAAAKFKPKAKTAAPTDDDGAQKTA